MIEISDVAHDRIAEAVKRVKDNKAVRVYIAGHG